MPKAFRPSPKHPSVPYLVRLHADLGAKLLENKKQGEKIAEAGRRVIAGMQRETIIRVARLGLLVVSIGLGIWIVGGSESFQTCSEQQQHYTPPEAKKSARDVVVTLHVWKTCFGAFLDASNAAIGAIATAVIAWFTITLANVGRQQGEDTKTSIDLARASVNAAKKSADVAERSLYELNRAFVFVKEIKPAPSATEGAIDIWIVWENNGTTQTKSMRTLVMSKEFPSDIPKDFDYPDGPNEEPGTASLGPKGAVSAAPITLSSQILVNLASGKHHYLVWGWVEYDDIFPNTDRHRTEFAAELKVAAVNGGESYVVVAVARRNYNGSDEECGQRFKRAQQIRPRIADADIIEAPDTLIATVTAELPPKPKT